MTVDPHLGWRATKNYVFEGTKKDAAGKEYHVSIATDRNGFRLFGNPNSNKIKILFLGDSFTYGIDVSNDKTYCALIAARLKNTECFAYGCGGYGTLQEYMILNKFIDLIKPNIIILQFCENDFIDNDFQLGCESYFNNNGRLRPYMDVHGHISYQNPKHPCFFFFPDSLLARSRLAGFVFDKFNRLLSYFLKRRKESIEMEIMRTGASHPGFRRSAKITKMLLDKIKKRAAGAEIFTFCSSDCQPMLAEFEKLSAQENFHFINGVPEDLNSYEKKGYTIRAADKGHWNELGNRIVADKIMEYLQKNEVISKFAPRSKKPADLQANPVRDLGQRKF